MKLDIFGKEWLDLVFEGRNKAYGAYSLRIKNPRVMLLSLIVGATSFTLLTLVIKGVFFRKNNEVHFSKTIDEEMKIVELINEPPPADIPDIPPPPPPPEPPKSVLDQVKFTNPKPASIEEVTEEIAKVEDLKEAVAGNKTQEGSPDGFVNLGETGEGDNEIVEESNEPVLNAGLEVPAGYPGGIQEFYKFVARNYKTDRINGQNIKGQVIVNFIVERDGTLTNIVVARDLGYGTGAEAVRVLKMSKKWSPGIQNGRPVRVKYSLPIKIDIRD